MFFGFGLGLLTVLGSAHLVLQLCFSKLCFIVAKKTFPGGWSGGRVVGLNENITTSAPNWVGVGAELDNNCVLKV